MPKIEHMTWNELIDLRRSIDATLEARATDLIGQKAVVPANLIHADTPVERHTAKIIRINRRRREGMFNVTIAPGGAFFSASISFDQVRLIESRTKENTPCSS